MPPRREPPVARVDPASLRRVLVRLPNWLGDVCFAAPAVGALAAAAPRAEVVAACRPSLAPLAALLPGVARVEPLLPRGGALRTAKRLRALGADAAVVFPRSFRAALPVALARVPVRVGFSSEARALLLTHAVRGWRPLRAAHRVDWFGALLAPVRPRRPRGALAPRGARGGPRVGRRVPPRRARAPRGRAARRARARRRLRDREALARGPLGRARRAASSRPAPTWSSSARPTSRPLARRVAAAAGAPVLVSAGRTDLVALAGLLARASLLVTNDTGPMHLAAALGTPVLALFGSTDPAVCAPRGAGTSACSTSASPARRAGCASAPSRATPASTASTSNASRGTRSRCCADSVGRVTRTESGRNRATSGGSPRKLHDFYLTPYVAIASVSRSRSRRAAASMSPAAARGARDDGDGSRRLPARRARRAPSRRARRDGGLRGRPPLGRVAADDDLALADCFVGLVVAPAPEGPWTEDRAREPRTTWIEIRRGRLVPHASWVRVGTQLAFRNTGTCEWNLRGYRESRATTQFNFHLGKKVEASDWEGAFLDRVGTMILRCDGYPGTDGVVYVVDHPWHDLTRIDRAAGKAPGEYVLSEVAPGEHRLVCRHLRLRVGRGARGGARVRISLRPRDPPRGDRRRPRGRDDGPRFHPSERASEVTPRGGLASRAGCAWRPRGPIPCSDFPERGPHEARRRPVRRLRRRRARRVRALARSGRVRAQGLQGRRGEGRRDDPRVLPHRRGRGDVEGLGLQGQRQGLRRQGAGHRADGRRRGPRARELRRLPEVDRRREGSGPTAMAKDERTALIDQKGCRYVPHVQWVRAETQIVVGNSDRAEHNIHGYKETMAITQFNFASPPEKTIDDYEGAFLEAPAAYLVKCDIHPWMSAYVHVVTHPYHDVTSAAAADGKKPGEFVLKDVPAGKYTLVAWHEGMDETAVESGGKIAAYNYSNPVLSKDIEVTVEAGKDAVVPDIVFEKK